jgi:hypothetical protein
LLKAALAIPTFAALAAASYAVHGSIVAVGILYRSLLRRHERATRHLRAPVSPS